MWFCIEIRLKILGLGNFDLEIYIETVAKMYNSSTGILYKYHIVRMILL